MGWGWKLTPGAVSEGEAVGSGQIAFGCQGGAQGQRTAA